jgi:hypothetical protein
MQKLVETLFTVTIGTAAVLFVCLTFACLSRGWAGSMMASAIMAAACNYFVARRINTVRVYATWALPESEHQSCDPYFSR